MAQKIQTRHDTAANWTSVNPVLMVGEQGYETDTGKVKVGDGTTAWASLAYNLVAGNVSGTVAIANGGTGQTAKAAAFDALSPTAATGDVIYFGATSNVALAGNTTTTKKFLAQTGTGTASAAPAWSTIAASDVPTLNQNTTGTAANVTGVVALVNGGTGTAAASANAAFNALSPMTTGGDMIYGGASGAATRLGNGSAGQILTSNGGTAAPSWQPAGAAAIQKNYLLNSAVDIQQAGMATTVTSAANPATTPTTAYVADQWYVNNVLGGGTIAGIITASLQAGAVAGSINGLQLKITTAPTGTNIGNGCELWQVLSAADSAALCGGNASFSVQVKGLSNVNQMGVQLFYATTEARCALGQGGTGGTGVAIGTEVLTTVNATTFSACTITGQAIGTGFTAGTGVVAVRIRIKAVSTGNSYDLNNGFIAEQAQLNLSSTLAAFQRAGATYGQELALCQRFYEVIGGSVANELLGSAFSAATTSAVAYVPYKVTKRVLPTVTYQSATSFSYNNASAGFAATSMASTQIGSGSFEAQLTTSGIAASNLPGVLLASTTSAYIILKAQI